MLPLHSLFLFLVCTAFPPVPQDKDIIVEKNSYITLVQRAHSCNSVILVIELEDRFAIQFGDLHGNTTSIHDLRGSRIGFILPLIGVLGDTYI